VNNLKSIIKIADQWEPFTISYLVPATMQNVMSGIPKIKNFNIPELDACPQPPDGNEAE
jgi:hypothetical protein